MRVTIHQPEHLPWLGFFHKICMADVYVVLDNVQFRKNYFQNRNKIRTADGWSWLNVPVKYRFGESIKDILIDNTNERWKDKYWKSICLSYQKSPFFNDYSKAIKCILDQEWTQIHELNLSFISKFIELLGITVNIVQGSSLGVKGKASQLLLNICKEVKAGIYISGISGRDYLNMDDFENAGIEVIFQEFHHPVYRQTHGQFIPCMSVIDLLFNHGKKSRDIINGKDTPVMEEVFL